VAEEAAAPAHLQEELFQQHQEQLVLAEVEVVQDITQQLL